MRRLLGIVFGSTSPAYVKMIKIKNPKVNVFKGQFVEIKYSQFKDKDVNVLGRIVDLEIKNVLLEEGLLPNLSEDATEYSSLEDIGIPRALTENVIAEIEIIGQVINEKILRPLVPPRPGDFVYKAREETLKQLFGSKKPIHIGYLKENRNINVFLNYQELISKHFAVLAMTGAGKSHTIAVIIEEIASRLELPIVVFDPHGEYSSMIIPKTNLKNLEDTKRAEEISSKVKIFVPGYVYPAYEEFFEKRYGKRREVTLLKFHPADLELYQIHHLLSSIYGLSKAQARVLEKSWDDVRYAYITAGLFRLNQIFEIIEEKIEGRPEQIAYATLKNKLELLFKRPYFGVSKFDIKQVVKKKQISVIDLSGLELVDQQAVAAIIAREILDARKKRETNMPPVLLILEEAHSFIPSGAPSASSATFKRIAAEGRKFLVGLGIVSQRPSKLDADVLSQCNTQIIMRLVNPNDQNYVRNVSEGLSSSDLETIRALGQGEALILGTSITIPVLVKIKDRLTQHGGYTPDVDEELESM